MQHHLYCIHLWVWKIKISMSDMVTISWYFIPVKKKQRGISMHQGDESMLVEKADVAELGKVDRLYTAARSNTQSFSYLWQ
ncbi:hypothetical protein BDV37DRAFT_228493 [Aspergillus pseudonomiae]|uniref:Uncharacterized protein n=1 Tax=Aspergillus pseudonomiae TaxID=1506151 RepID=A0A5N7D0C4_9EURO|nr:uncharacterized protein BDV37DRAFT_228493 [Aspergillus pseudonomiae]KAE8399547.1 hypothetical protein BDV37DRAFT_228493 [Aspergillus pseudonomiae]